MENTQNIKDNLMRVLSSIREAERLSGRKEGEVSLLAVSKFHSAEKVKEAIEAGQMYFGENRVQEAVTKFNEVRESYPNVHLHIIGTLQSNKIKKAVLLSNRIESADSIECLKGIEKHCALEKKLIEVLLEYHTGEESKAGFLHIEDMREALELSARGEVPHISIRGFMTMAPLTNDEALQRKSFAALREAKEVLEKEFPSMDLKVLSMGMSSDYRAAIMEGSTEVRIGTAIFGSREK